MNALTLSALRVRILDANRMPVEDQAVLAVRRVAGGWLAAVYDLLAWLPSGRSLSRRSGG
jgi:hypothetical protein